MNVQASLVRKCRQAHIRRADIVRDVGQLVDEDGDLAEHAQVGNYFEAEFQLQRRDQGGQVAVADPLAVAIDRPLNLNGTGFDGDKGIGYTKAAIIVRVNSDRRSQMRNRPRGRFSQKIGQRAAIGIAQHDQVRASLMGGLDGRQRVVWILAKAVEEMLGVIEDLAIMLLQEANRVGDHGEILLEADPKHLGDVQRPGFTNDGYHRRFRRQQHLHLGVLLNLHSAAARHSERGDLRVLPFALRRLLEKRGVLGI